MALDQATAEKRIRERLDRNGLEVDSIQVLQKGSGVWVARIETPDENGPRQGIFTDEQLTTPA